MESLPVPASTTPSWNFCFKIDDVMTTQLPEIEIKIWSSSLVPVLIGRAFLEADGSVVEQARLERLKLCLTPCFRSTLPKVVAAWQLCHRAAAAHLSRIASVDMNSIDYDALYAL